jgi:WD40 repeat protein
MGERAGMFVPSAEPRSSGHLRRGPMLAALAVFGLAAPMAEGQGPVPREWRLSDAHTSTIVGLAYSPDGRMLASASLDQAVKLWDVTSGRVRATFRGHVDRGLTVAFAPDGKLLATVGDNPERDRPGGGPERSRIGIQLWDIETGRLTRTIGHPSGTIRSIVFSPDGARLAAIDDDAKVRIWDVITGALQTLSGLPDRAWKATLTRDLATLAVATGGMDQSVIVMETATRSVLATLTGPRSVVLSLAFSPDGTRLAAGIAPQGRGRSLPQPPDQPPEVWIWDLRPGAPKEGKILGRLQDSATIVAFSPDGRRLFGGGDDERAPKIWDIATGEERVWLDQPGIGHVYAVAFSPDGASLAMGGVSTTIAIYDADTGRARAQLSGHSAYSLAFLPDDKTLVAGMEDGTVALWDVAAGRVRTAFPGHGGRLEALAVSPDGKWLAAGGRPGGFGSAKLVIRALDTNLPAHGSPTNGGAITALAFSPDSKTLAAADDLGTIDLLARPLFYSRRPPWKAHDGRVRALAFSPDVKSLASVGQDGAIKVWDAADGRQRMSLPGRVDRGAQTFWMEVVVRDGETAYVTHNGPKDHPIPNFAVAFLPDGKTLVVGYEDSVQRAGVALYDLNTGRQREDRKPPKEDAGIWGELLGIVLTPDGRTLAAAGYNSVSLWDVASWKRRTHFKAGGMPPVRAMAVSHDGKTLATGTSQVIQLWSLPELLKTTPAR